MSEELLSGGGDDYSAQWRGVIAEADAIDGVSVAGEVEQEQPEENAVNSEDVERGAKALIRALNGLLLIIARFFKVKASDFKLSDSEESDIKESLLDIGYIAKIPAWFSYIIAGLSVVACVYVVFIKRYQMVLEVREKVSEEQQGKPVVKPVSGSKEEVMAEARIEDVGEVPK